MYTTILLAAALQDWERYSTHALAARDVAATLAKGAAQPLHVLSIYDYPPVETTDRLCREPERQLPGLYRAPECQPRPEICPYSQTLFDQP